MSARAGVLACAAFLLLLPVSSQGAGQEGWTPVDPDEAAAPAPPRGGAPGATVPVERETHLMGTRLRVSVRAADRRTGLQAIEEAFQQVRETESLLSTWRPDSELSAVNQAARGQDAPLSDRLRRLLLEALAWAEETGGAFQPAVGALVDAWDLRGEGRIPSPAELRLALESVGSWTLATDGEGCEAVRLGPGTWLDAGGFGKGAALRDARQALLEAGIEEALLDFGGQILTLGRGGAESRGEGWDVAVAHPSRRGRPAWSLTIGERSISTSGGSERFVTPEGRLLSHVLDPRSGHPVPPWGSVTVVADDPLVADVVSTALFVMGPDEGWAWAHDRQDVGVLFLMEDGEAGSASVRARSNPALDRFARSAAWRPGQETRRPVASPGQDSRKDRREQDRREQGPRKQDPRERVDRPVQAEQRANDTGPADAKSAGNSEHP